MTKRNHLQGLCPIYCKYGISLLYNSSPVCILLELIANHPMKSFFSVHNQANTLCEIKYYIYV